MAATPKEPHKVHGFYAPDPQEYWLDVAVPTAAARLRAEVEARRVPAEDMPYRSRAYPW